MVSERASPLRWMLAPLRTPPLGRAARVEAGVLLRRVQRGERLGMPHSRPLPGIGPRVHELRVWDPQQGLGWRIVYRIDPDGVLVVHWFAKKSRVTPASVIALCRRRLRGYDHG